MSYLVQVEAYLGPDKPETLAEDVVAVENEAHLPQFGVVRQDRESGECTLHSTHFNERAALGAVQAVTTHKTFGILTNVRTQVLGSTEALVEELEARLAS